jgi:hypothetical protein
MTNPKFTPPTSPETKQKPAEPPQKQASVGKQNDRAASNQSGMGSNSAQRDMTSGQHSGNQ